MSTQTGLLERLETKANSKALVCASRVPSRASRVDVFAKGQDWALVKNFEVYGSDEVNGSDECRMGGYKIGSSKGLSPILKSTVSKEGLKFDEIP